MPRYDDSLTALLRAMLWDEPLSIDPSLLMSHELWHQASRQQLSHMLAVWALNHAYAIPHPTVVKQRVYRTLQRRERQNNFLLDLVSLLHAHGIEPVLLKGYALSLLYPNPDMRDYSDVDLYIGEHDYNRMIPVIREAYPDAYWFSEEHAGLHFVMVKDAQFDLIAEMHRVTMEFSRMPRANRAFQQFTQEEMNHPKQQTLDGVVISIPSLSYNALYVFLHAWHHFAANGVGLRQMGDWALALHAARSEQHLADVLSPLLKHMHMLEVWQTFGWVLVNRLGLPQDEFPLYNISSRCARRGERLYRQLLRDGHCGRQRRFCLCSHTLYVYPFSRPTKGRLFQKIHTLLRMIFDSIQLAKLFPRFAFYTILSIPLASTSTEKS